MHVQQWIRGLDVDRTVDRVLVGRAASARPAGYPIGYWLKRLDRAIESALESTLAGDDLTRRHWQTLNFLHDAPNAAALAEALRPFRGDGSIMLRSGGRSNL